MKKFTKYMRSFWKWRILILLWYGNCVNFLIVYFWEYLERTIFHYILSVVIPQAYIQYMKFARRAEGIKSARTVFKRAREDTRSCFQVYVAAALMEYYSSKDKNIAFRIFELGLKKFPDSPDYVLCYIDYLSHLNEDNNTRVLFERVLSSGSLEPEKSVEIWNRFLEFESNIGDLASIVKVERRRSAVLESVCTPTYYFFQSFPYTYCMFQ